MSDYSTLLKLLVVTNKSGVLGEEYLQNMEKIMNFKLEYVKYNDYEVLHWAAEKNKPFVLQFLKDIYGLTTENIRSDNNYALRIASSKGHLEVIKHLFEVWNLETKDIGPSMMIANEHGHQDIVDYFCRLLIEQHKRKEEAMKPKWDFKQKTAMEVISAVFKKYEITKDMFFEYLREKALERGFR